MRFPKIYLGLDNCFAIKRWINPEDWMRVTREIGFSYIMQQNNGISSHHAPFAEANNRDGIIYWRRFVPEDGIRLGQLLCGAAMPSGIRTLLFDVDGTLFDRRHAQNRVVEELYRYREPARCSKSCPGATGLQWSPTGSPTSSGTS